MLKKIIPLIMLLGGSVAGAAAGVFLRPDVDAAETESADIATDINKHTEEAEQDTNFEYVRMNNQFVVPLAEEDSLKGLVLLSLSLEAPVGQKEAIYQREPKLRDSFLQVLFDYANTGGFEGTFTDVTRLTALRRGLRETAQNVMGNKISDVLIVEIARQDF